MPINHTYIKHIKYLRKSHAWFRDIPKLHHGHVSEMSLKRTYCPPLIGLEYRPIKKGNHPNRFRLPQKALEHCLAAGKGIEDLNHCTEALLD
jgi:hypothetical protein